MKTTNQLYLDMVRSTLLYHMMVGTFGKLPTAQCKGPRDNTGGFYHSVDEFCQTTFGKVFGRGTIHDIKCNAIDNGAAVFTPSKAKQPPVQTPPPVKQQPVSTSYDTQIPAHASAQDRAIADSLSYISDDRLVLIIQNNITAVRSRQRVTRGILLSYARFNRLIGYQRFALLMALAHEIDA